MNVRKAISLYHNCFGEENVRDVQYLHVEAGLMAKGESDFQILHRHLFSRREEFRKGEA